MKFNYAARELDIQYNPNNNAFKDDLVKLQVNVLNLNKKVQVIDKIPASV